ncbi:hypothetical protein UFOVP1151_38 [uncultured Caudovirales phage]|uniref:Uncharacterized protein n=1 Tax=uncultured Caudovirales phage TaxID=2100421 RepID=A0A6J5QZ52_9CAUD|nr:hypothetical protein UFOVP1151_38 [uncultured Caudovirales phage]
MFNKDNRFDVDLQYGQEGERWLMWLGVDQARVEVKTERDKWFTTRNAIFEFRSRGKPSGFAVTQADYWMHNFFLKGRCKHSITFDIEDLRDFLRLVYRNPYNYGARICTGGDDHTSDLIVVPMSQLYKASLPYV